MKTISLTLHRLKQYFLRNKLLFILFIIGGMLNAISVAYCYGNLLPIISNRDSEAPEHRKYTIRFDDIISKEMLEGMSHPVKENLEAFAKDSLIQGCSYECFNINTLVGDYPFKTVSGTSEFTGVYQVLASTPADVAVGDRVTLEGNTYQVIGIITDGIGGQYYIPTETFTKLGYVERVTRINAIASQRQDPLNDEVMSLIYRQFPQATYAGGGYDASVDMVRSNNQIPGIVINAFISVISYIFLLRYLVDSALDETIISMIVGATRGRMTSHIFWEATLLCLAANGSGLLLHRLLYKPFFQDLNLAEALTYSSSDYATICLLLLVLSLLVTVPFSLKYLRLSPIAARREHT